jgi:hypothetical protein
MSHRRCHWRSFAVLRREFRFEQALKNRGAAAAGSEFVKKSRVLWKTWIAFTIGS